MDPLSDVLSLLKPRSYISGGFEVAGDMAIQFPKHQGIKCYAMVSGQCWLSMESVPDAVLLTAGDCFLLPRGLPFCLTTDLSLTPVDFHTLLSTRSNGDTVSQLEGGGRYIVGGHFLLTGSHADMLLGSLPPIVHIRKESDKAAMRWSLERLKEELRDPQPGGSLIAQQLAYMMLIQALRLHLAEGEGQWRRLALRPGGQTDERSDHLHARRSRASMDTTETGGARRYVALDLCSKVQREGWDDSHGVPDPLAHAVGRRPAEEFRRFCFGHRLIARLRIRKRFWESLQKGHGLFAETIQSREQSHAAFFTRSRKEATASRWN